MNTDIEHTAQETSWRDKLRIIIFEADTTAGKAFDVGLLIAIVLSILTIMLESVQEIKIRFGEWLNFFEIFFTLLFTLEYIARIITIKRPTRYMTSFFGLIDLISILPTYINFFVGGAHILMIVRSFRLLRVFRIFKLMRFLGEASQLAGALRASRAKITVFLGFVFILVVVLGSIMYLIEGGENGFSSIPRSIYWAIVTLTTVGYGDIAPQTVIGQTIASLIMILGYGILAVPTGIVTTELAISSKKNQHTTRTCAHCSEEGHDDDADYCKYCGAKL